MEFIKKIMSFIRSVYSEADGSGSSTRVHIGILTAFTIGVGVSFSYLVHTTRVSIEQFNSFLASAATFLVSTCGPLYGINKLSDWAKSKNQTQSDPPQGS